jgi:hypothetical protein
LGWGWGWHGAMNAVAQVASGRCVGSLYSPPGSTASLPSKLRNP